MVDSYVKAMQDPANELVHLFEIREAAWKHFGKKEAAVQKAFGIDKSKWRDFGWSELGRLANDASLRQGRHRGMRAIHPTRKICADQGPHGGARA